MLRDADAPPLACDQRFSPARAARVRRGDVRHVVASVRLLDQIAAAHQAMEDGGVPGRHHVVVREV